MIFGSLPVSALAGNGLTVGIVSQNKETESQTDVQAETETEILTEAESGLEPATEAETGTEPATEAESGTEPATEAESGTEPVTEAETEAGTEEFSEAESETDIILEDQGISEAAVFEAATEDGKVVKLSAPEGAFTVPADQVTMTADPLTEEQKAAIEEQLQALAAEDGMKMVGYVAYDINLWVGGEIVRPLLPVEVTFEDIAVAETAEEEDVPEDMSQVETAGFQMDTATNEITDVNDTTVADDATPINATVAVEVEHFTPTGTYMFQVDESSPKNYNFTMEQTGGVSEEGAAGTEESGDGSEEENGEESGGMITFEVNVESLKGIGEGKLTLVPSVVDGTEEAGEGGTQEGEAEGTPVNVTFQSGGEEVSEMTNPTALGAKESWTQKIQIPVSALEGVKNPMMNIALMNGGNTITTINQPFSLIANPKTFEGGIHTWTLDDTYNGTVVVKGGATVTIKGSGTIDATNTGESAIRIQGGSTVTLDGVTITGGTGTNKTDANMEPRGDETFKVGGGVYVENGTLELVSGTITENTAHRGGGIFVNLGANFVMTGGTVSANSTDDGDKPGFAGEGGGIFVYGTATISGGQIINNKCGSTTDIGGGGLYVNNSGIATLINARVIGNTAEGFGGGIAGCCHGEMSLVALDGLALYGNTANGNSHTLPKYDDDKGLSHTTRETVAEVVDHFKASTAEGINKDNSKDLYNAGSTIVSNYMIGGGSEKYTGKAAGADVTIQDDQVKKYENTNIALVANPSEESKSKVPTNGVLISENYSKVHGGGIGCNGGLYFGSAETTEIDLDLLNIEIKANKQLNWSSKALTKDQFTFELLGQDEKTLIATAKNDADGNVKFMLNGYVSDLIADFDSSEPTYTFYLREQKGNSSDDGIVYDKSLYKIEVTLGSTVESETVELDHTTTGNKNFNTIKVTYKKTTYTAEKTTITKIRDEDGAEINGGAGTSVNSATFNNKTTKPHKEEKTPGDKKGVTVGSTIEYRITYENYKDKEATVTITDNLDPGVNFVSASNDGAYDQGKHTITWTLENVPAHGKTGSKGEVTFKVTVNEKAVDYATGGDGKVLNQASVQVGNDPAVNTEIVENPTSEPHKTEPIPGNGKTVKIGELITYNVSWENYMDQPATVVITDRLDPGVDVDEASISDGGSYDAVTRTITWTLENRPARGNEGSSGIVSFQVKVNEKAYDPGAAGNKDGIFEPGDLKVLNQANVKVGNDDAVDTEIMENPVTNPEKTPTTVTTPNGATTDLGNHGLVQIGDVIHYEITWANYKDAGADVVVTDKLVDGLTYVAGSAKAYDNTETEISSASITAPDGTSGGGTITWDLGNRPAKSFGKVSFDAKVNESAGSQVENDATVTVGEESTVTNKVDNPRPEKEETTPGEHKGVKVGDTITYTITWRNNYDEAADVIITDTLDEGLTFESADPDITSESTDAAGKTVLTWNLGKKEPGPGTVTLTVKVNDKALVDHVVDNEAFVQVGSNPAVRTDKVENPVPEKKEVTPGADKLVNVGDVITYEIDWYNTHDDARTVTITDKLDPNVKYVPESASDGGKCENGIITWTIAADPNTSGKVTFQVEVLASAAKYGTDEHGKVTNSATVQVENDNEVTVGPVENPVPKKEETDPGNGKGVKPGDQITYDIYWENSNDSAADVMITDDLDVGVKFVEAVGEHAGDAAYNQPNHTLTWTFKAEAGAKGKVSFIVEVLESAVDYATGGDGKVLNKATVEVGNSSVVTNEVENPTTEPHKTENAPGDGKGVQVGDKITYTVTFENYKNEPATVVITDKLDPGLDYVRGTAISTPVNAEGDCVEGVYDESKHTLTWTITDMPKRGDAYSTGTVTFEATVNRRAVEDADDPVDGIFGPDDSKVLNQASVEVDNEVILTEIVENPVTNPEKNATAVEPGAGNHEVNQPAKNDDDTYNDVVVQVGDTITYTISWENYEDEPADVTITDTLDWGLTYVTGSASNGGTCSKDENTGRETITWTLKNQPEHSSDTVSFKATVNKNAREAGKVENDASVKVGNHPALSTKPVENPVPEKTEVTPGEHIGVYPGDEITYEISWMNTHDEPAEVVITDVLDPGVEYVEAIGEHKDNAKLTTGASLESSTGATDQNRQTVTWTFTAEPNTSGKVSFRVRVLESAVGYEPGSEDPNKDGKVVNQAQVQVGNSSAYTSKVENPTTNPHKTETAPGDKEGVKVGDQIDYVVTYENYKNTEATIKITDRLDPGLTYVEGSASNGGVYNWREHTITWTIPNVPARGEPGSTGYVTFSATVNEKALDYGESGEADGIFVPGDGKVVNQAQVQVDHDPVVDTEIVENPVTEPEKDATAVTPAEGSGDDIAVEPNADGTFNDTVVQVGDTIEYTISWENYEETEATVIITDQLEDVLTYVEGSAGDNSEYDAETHTITWKLTNVPARGEPGSTGFVTFKATVNENALPNGKVVNDASVKVGNHGAVKTKPVENPVPEKTEVTPGADLGVKPGDVITYEISWENTYDVESTVTITDELDPGLRFAGAIGGHAEDAQLTTAASLNSTTGAADQNRQTVTWTFKAQPNTKGKVSFKARVLVSAVDYEDGGDGKVVNRAKVQVGNNSRYTSEVENPTTEPHKTEVTPGNKAGVRVGDTIEYEVTYENYRNEPATVTITDELDPGLDYVDGSASDGGVYDANTRTITWTLENVPARGEAGSTGSVTFQATVNQKALDDADDTEHGIFAPNDEKVLNQAEVQVGDDPKIKTEIVENPVTEPEKEVTEITPANKDVTLELGKDGTYNDVVVQVGDVITYTIRWENYETDDKGNPANADVTVTDVLDVGLTYVEGSAKSSTGETGSYDDASRMITWTLKNVAPGPGTVTFQATVNENAWTDHKVENDASVQVGNYPALSTKPVENPVPEKTEVTPGADLGVYPGEEITYDITWENAYDEESTVTITDELDPGVEFVEAIGDHAADARVSYGASFDRTTGQTTNRQIVTWTFQADANTKGTVSFRVKVLDSAVDYEDGGDGKVVNRAKVQVGNSSTYTNKVENPTTEPHKTEVTPGDTHGVRVGDTIEYRVDYENYKDAEATVTITDTLDPGLDFAEASNSGKYDEATRTITWTLENVPARGEEGSTGHVTFQAVVNEKALDYGSKETDNNPDDIFVTGDGKVLNQAEVQVDHDPKIKTEIVENPVTEPDKKAAAVAPANTEVEVTPNADGTYNDVAVQVGDTITYTISWENYEETTATVTIKDTLDEGLTYVPNSATSAGKYDEATRTITWTLPNIPARGLEGSTGTVSFQAVVNENAWTDHMVKNDASVQVGSHPELSTKPVENPVPEKKEVTPGENLGVYPGDEITYEISWSNTYDEEAQVVITDKLDPGVSYVQDSAGKDSSYDEATHTLTWIFKAAGNTSGTVSFKVTVLESAVGYEPGSAEPDKDGKVVNQAQVQVGNSSTYTNKVENPTTNPHKTETAPGDKEGVQVGDRIDYMVTYENYKNAEATVTIKDRLDPGLDYVAGSASNGGVYDAATRTITWTLEKVPARGTAGSTGYVTFSAVVNRQALDYGTTGTADGIFVPGDGKVVNQASVQVDHDPAVDTEIVENPVTEPEKDAAAVTPAAGSGDVTVQPNGDGTYNDAVVQVGDVITYVIRWENYEETEATVIITDRLESGLTYVAGSASGGGVYDETSRTITWTLTHVPKRGSAGSTGTVTFQAIVNENAVPAGEVMNDASVKVGNHRALTTEPVENPVPEKEESTPGADAGVYPGEEITYEITWKNTYNAPSTVTVTDVLDPGVEFVKAVGEHAAEASYNAQTHTVTWTFTAQAGTGGKVSFTVKVLESAVDYGTEGGDGRVVNRAKVQVGNNSRYTNEVENPTTNPHKTEPDPGEDLPVEVGDTVTYNVFWENYTNGTADVVITDHLDAGLTYVTGSASDGGVYDAAARTIIWTLKNVPARGSEGSSGYVAFQAVVNEAAREKNVVENQAGVKVGNYPEILTNIVENPTEPVVITKIDAETGEALAGAVLRIVDANGTSIEEWTTDGTPHTVRAKLTAGATYTLVEVSAPRYYAVAQPIEFTVGADGRIAPITMEDRRASSTDAAIEVTKTLLYDGNPINAVDETFYVALFSDEERTVRVSDVKALEFKNASAATVRFGGLELGKTYYIGETGADGVMIEAGQLADGTLYTADFNEGYEAVVREEDGTVTRHFSNYLEQIPDNQYYLDGTLTVTKQLLDENGMPLEGQNQTFYAGVFADAEHTVLSDRVERNIIPLTLNGTSSTSETTAVSILPGETLTLYVTEVDETGTPVSTDTGFMYTLVLDKMNVTITEENPDGHVTMTNRPYLSQDFYKSGELTITKQLLGADGASRASDETFYAGIFADEDYTELAGNVSANIVELALGGNASVTKTVDVSFGTEESVTLYVTEVTKDGTPVENAASFEYEVSVEGSTVTLSSDASEASTVITNREPEEPETEPGGEIEKNRTSTSETDSSISQTSVKTGDETPILLYLGIFAAAAVLLLVLLFTRRKRSSR